MVVRLRSPLSWVFCLVGIIAMGILSRVVHTGLAIFDKYLGDALYAMMVYGILRLLSGSAVSAVGAMVAMTAIELFQPSVVTSKAASCGHLKTGQLDRTPGQVSYTLP